VFEVREFGSVMVLLGVSFVMSWLIETLTEAILGNWADYVVERVEWIDEEMKVRLLQLVPLALGVYSVGFLYQFDFISWLSVTLSATAETFKISAPVVIAVTPYGRIVSGLAVGQGSHYMHELIGKFLKKPDDLLRP